VAGPRAIRIDMLERLADMLRAQDSRGGFEATADMLSITGLSLEQFAELMQGLGYRAERGERPKQRPAPAVAAPQPGSEAPAADSPGAPPAPGAVPTLGDDEAGSEPPAEELADTAAPGGAAAVPDATAPQPGAETATGEPAQTDDADATARASETASAASASTEARGPETEAAAAGQTEDPGHGETPETAATETEVFYTFTWAPRRRPQPQGRGKREGAKAGAKGPGKAPGKGARKPKCGEAARPESAARRQGEGPRKDKPIDPDNPFAAALMGLRDKI